jgi:hypothetical protein
MLQNPLIQAVFLFLGSYTLMSVLSKYSPADKVATLAAGVVALVIWMLRYNRPQLYTVYQNPLAKPVIDLVCKLTKDQPPVDASVGSYVPPGAGRAAGAVAATAAGVQSTAPRPRAPVSARNYGDDTGTASPSDARQGQQGAAQTENSKLLLQTDQQFKQATRRLKDLIRGSDDAIDQTMRQIQQNISLRERSSASTAMPPLGMFLFIGRPGLGKRTLAIEIGRMLYAGDSVGIVDFADPSTGAASLTSAAKVNPYQTFIIENITAGTQQAQNDLLAICAGQPLVEQSSGARVSFRHCLLFFLIHQEADAFPMPAHSGAGTGYTLVVDHLVQTADLDQMLALALHGVAPFQLPEPEQQAEVIALLMDKECRKYKLSLSAVSAAILAREVEEVGKLRSFKTSPARIARILSKPIHDALESGAETVDLS